MRRRQAAIQSEFSQTHHFSLRIVFKTKKINNKSLWQNPIAAANGPKIEKIFTALQFVAENKLEALTVLNGCT
jgi:hypothetical protein